MPSPQSNGRDLGIQDMTPTDRRNDRDGETGETSSRSVRIIIGKDRPHRLAGKIVEFRFHSPCESRHVISYTPPFA